MGVLRIEESKVVPISGTNVAAKSETGADEWRARAIQAGQRLEQAETQLKDLRIAADELRERVTKYKTRLDAATAKQNDLTVELIKVSEERDVLRDRVARQEIIKQKVHQFRQDILDGTLWELFAEL